MDLRSSLGHKLSRYNAKSGGSKNLSQGIIVVKIYIYLDKVNQGMPYSNNPG